ncbi:hypothetical protein BJV82DRAFT_655905 [Fennellomyces sp. T-0311]|nr:hypothetical protein BJV82DRAFT_655905 [Fennellomyces sp. T-0311]
MTHIFEQPMLSLSPQSIDRIHDVDDLGAMWNVFTKCKAHLENGQRLENMSWRLWYHEKQQQSQRQQFDDYFSYIPTTPSLQTCSSSASSVSSHTSSSIKRFISLLSPGQDVWSHQPPTAPTTVESHDRQTDTNQQASAEPVHEDQVVDDDCDDDLDDLDDDDDISLDEEDDLFDDEELLDHADDDEGCFKKREPAPLPPQPSLLSTMLNRQATTSSLTITSCNTKPDHYLRKELSDSLRRNVLWEHLQQKTTFYTSTNNRRKQQQQQQQQQAILLPKRPPQENNPSNTGWLESFHGW